VTETPAAAVEIEGEPTSVYRLYDATGVLLYVGVSSNLVSRLAAHASEKHWWPQVAKKTVVTYGSRGEALMEEDRAIRTESPVHNVAGRREKLRPEEKIASLKRRVAAPQESFRFDGEFLASIDAFAAKHELSRHDAVGVLLLRGLEAVAEGEKAHEAAMADLRAEIESLTAAQEASVTP
jgi:predicted GIY-YIG superfamily endonuclease